jgi:hypothetical protein
MGLFAQRGMNWLVAGALCAAPLSSLPSPRDYYQGVSPDERKQIRFIVDTLANSNLASICFHQNDLNAAGDRIGNMHPFRFLEVLLADPHVRKGVLKIRQRSLIWPKFYEGIRGSLSAEAHRHNLRTDHIEAFALSIHQDPHWMTPLISHQQWEHLVEGLLERSQLGINVR